jgi:glycosyltransferase involved in cell wall biosynthesis
LPQAGCRLTVLLGPDGPQPGEGYAVSRSRWPTERPAVRIAWEQLVQPWALRRAGVDVAHGPVFAGPLAADCPFVVTVHDLSFLRHPHLFRPANRLYLSTMARVSARRARRVIAVSAHAARETVQLLGVRREKIDVIYHGVDPTFRPLKEEQVADFRARKGLPARFVLFVGTLEPRKNVLSLVEAFARLAEPDVALVLAGGRGWYYEEIFERIEQLGLHERVVLPGYVPYEELALWYNAAAVFAYPSLYEGFGMPVTEAQACGTPVLTSNVTSLPEAAGDGALQVDPHDVEEIAQGLRRLLVDAALRDDLRRRGLAHAARFVWQRTADETLDVYRRALDEDGEK